MATRIATVFGGSGFIGRYVVKRLVAAGYQVRVAVRDTEAAMFLKPMGAIGQVVPLHVAAGDQAAVARAVDGAAAVVNLIGILAEAKPGDFQRIHADAAGLIATAAARAGVAKFVQVSAIGADAAHPSLYARSKAAGEAAVRAAFPAAVILRPSVVFGQEDEFFNRFARIAQLAPFMPVIGGASRFQPVYVGDVADAVMVGLSGTVDGKTFELGGPKVWTMRELLQFILAETRRNRPLIAAPMGLVRLQAALLERLPGRLLTRDQLLLLARDNVASGPGLAELGLAATPVEAVVPAYLRRYRPGGGQRDSYMTA
jgi:NADH dehydrogenase